MRNIAIRLSYDGTAYHGWQKQKKDATVQETLGKALSEICGHEITPVGCGRTDAGVHAKTYCASFRTTSSIPVCRLSYAANSLLPADISVSAAADAPDDFNAILSCEKKEYTYLIHNSRIRDPFLQNRAFFVPVPLDAEIMKAAAEAFVGRHDFAAVRSVGTDVKTTVRTVFYCAVEKRGQSIELRVCADGFLYNMARAIAGTVIYAALGKIRPEDIGEILKTGDRRLAGPTAPPHGLYMTRVWYPGAVGEMME